MMLWRGDDGSMIVEEPLSVQIGMPWLMRPIASMHYMRDGRVITYRPEPLRLPPPTREKP